MVLRLILIGLTLCVAACSSTSSSKAKSDYNLVNELQSREQRVLDVNEALAMVKALPTTDQGSWKGVSGNKVNGVGALTVGDLVLSGTWKDKRLNGHVRGFYRGLLLVDGEAKDGVMTEGSVYQHITYMPLFSNSWDEIRTHFVASTGGTHAVLGFRGVWTDGVPSWGRVCVAKNDWRITAYSEGELDPEGNWQGVNSILKRKDIPWDQVDTSDEDFELSAKGFLLNGCREGKWTGPDLDANYRNGRKHGYCRIRVPGFKPVKGSYVHAWFGANYENGVPKGVVRVTPESGPIRFIEAQQDPDADPHLIAGWNLVQPKVGPPYMEIVDRSGNRSEELRRVLPEGTTLAGFIARFQTLDLGGGVTWHGQVQDGKATGFGRKMGHHPYTSFEEGWFENGQPTGYTVGLSYKDNGSNHPRFFYVWKNGQHASDTGDVYVYRLDEQQANDEALARIYEERRAWALRMRPDSEKVWKALAWERKVINPDGDEHPAVMKTIDELDYSDVACVRKSFPGGIENAFLLVKSVEDSNNVLFFGFGKPIWFPDHTKVPTFQLSETGPLFDNIVLTCIACDGEGTRTQTEVRHWDEDRMEYDSMYKEYYTNTYHMTEHTTNTFPCDFCAGSGATANLELGH